MFTRVFVEELTQPGLDLGGLAIAVREKVAALARQAKGDRGQPEPHEQTPAYYDQTIGGRIFLAGLSVPVAPPVPAFTAATISEPIPRAAANASTSETRTCTIAATATAH